MRIPTTARVAIILAIAFVGCRKPTTPPTAKSEQSVPSRRITLLVTSHEVGKLVTRGPALLAQWQEREGWPDALAFSTGDLFTGDPISSYFAGESTAEFAKAMLYKAASLGNHDLGLGLGGLQSFREHSGITFLAANLQERSSGASSLGIPGVLVETRGGIKVGVVGLTGKKTVGATSQLLDTGFKLKDLDSSLTEALKEAKAKGAEVTLVLFDDCFEELSSRWAAHPDWAADIVVGSKCADGQAKATIGQTQFFSVEPQLENYASVRVELLGDGKRTVSSALVPLPEKGPEDPDLVVLRKRWEARLKEELGHVIGYTKTGFRAGDPRLAKLVTTALMEQTGSEAAYVNRKGLREGFAKGDITKASIYGLIPFVNAVLTTKVRGSVLEELRKSPEALVAAPAKLDPEKLYQLATIEFLYFGTEGLNLPKVAVGEPALSGQVWQTPIIEWVTKLHSTEKKPLEKLLK